MIDASHCFEPRRKSIGKKRNDITDYCRKLVVKAYGEFTEGIFGDKNGIYCESKIFDSVEFGYNKIVVERPLLDENGKPVLKKGKRVADASLRDTENVPLEEDIDTYFAREYDMDGYVIIFTSNLLSEAEYKKAIPPELQTRFDLVCEFEEPTMAEKTAFLDLLLEMAKTKYSEQFAEIEMTEDEKKQLYAFDYSSLSALRDIKRVFNNRLMDYFTEKGVLR